MIDGWNNQLLAQFLITHEIIYSCSNLISVLLNNFDEGITGITITETGVPGKGARFEITVPKGEYRFTGAYDK
jgi:hypothetical protein